MEYAALISVFITLFVIIDPVGLAPLFVALTQGADARHRRGVAIRSCIIGAALLTLFGLLGEAVLGVVGISLPAFRIAGGILLFITALDMLFERRSKRRESAAHPTREPEDPSVFPIAIPLIAGPGAITTMILLTGQGGDDWGWVVSVHLVMLAVIAVTFALFMAAGVIERALGPTGINVVTRLLGMLLAALSVQFVLDGLAAFGLSMG